MPIELANHAKPNPAARPPNMAPQGRLGAGTAGAVGAGAVGLTAPCAGATWRCVTLLDCRPIERPPPKRAASAETEAKVKTKANIEIQNFIKFPKELFTLNAVSSNKYKLNT